MNSYEFLRGGVSHKQKSRDFGADPDHDLDPGFLLTELTLASEYIYILKSRVKDKIEKKWFSLKMAYIKIKNSR